MTCPHSTAFHASPETCSLCLQASPTVYRVGPDGVLMVDGVARGSIIERNKRKQREEVALISPAARKKLQEEDDEYGEG